MKRLIYWSFHFWRCVVAELFCFWCAVVELSKKVLKKKKSRWNKQKTTNKTMQTYRAEWSKVHDRNKQKHVVHQWDNSGCGTCNKEVQAHKQLVPQANKQIIQIIIKKQWQCQSHQQNKIWVDTKSNNSNSDNNNSKQQMIGSTNSGGSNNTILQQ